MRIMTDFQEIKELAIARAKEAANYYGLVFKYTQSGTWIYTHGYDEKGRILFFSLKARGWKNASDAFVKAATEWYQKERAK